jgi:hypothetical protein
MEVNPLVQSYSHYILLYENMFHNNDILTLFHLLCQMHFKGFCTRHSNRQPHMKVISKQILSIKYLKGRRITSMNTYRNQYYLIIKPLSEDPTLVEPYVSVLADLTGLDQITVRQKFIGSALQILMVHPDQAALEEISQALRKEGFPSTVISKDELRGSASPVRSSSLTVNQKAMTFLSPQSEVLLSLDGTQKCLLVLATMDFKGLQRKRMARKSLQVNDPLPLEEVLKYIFQNNPILDIYTPGSGLPIRIDSSKFNFTCLGEANRNSSALNFPIIMKEVSHFASSLILDTGFGESELPFLQWPEEVGREKLIREFTVYSHFVFLAYQKELLAASPPQNAFRKIFLSDDIGHIFWAGGPLRLPENSDKHGRVKTDRPCSFEQRAPSTPPSPPPEDKIGAYRSDQFLTWIPGLKHSWLSSRKFIKSLGPPWLLYPITFLALISFGSFSATKRPESLSLGFLAVGGILFIHSFVLLKRKRTIENCPTSKIRSMPMGHIEVRGAVQQKYYLKSPYTFTDCVYYSYKIYEEERTKDGYRYQLREWGNSGHIPFYLEDDTGRVLVQPKEAIIQAGYTETLLGDPMTMLLGGNSSSRRKRKIVETVIPIGYPLYVIGFAHRLKMSQVEKKKKLVEKLRSLKANHSLMGKFDLNGDGKIGQEEWELARKEIEEEVLLEGLSSPDGDDRIAIGEHPSGGLFYISDKQEEGILASMAWRIPLSFVLGMGGFTGGAFYLLKCIFRS